MRAEPPSVPSYEIQRQLGRGAMAVVYLARDIRHGRDVALKVLRPEIAAVVGGARFRREILIAAQLSHPNILALFDSGETDAGSMYYVMPFVSGGTLRDRLARERPLPVEEAVRIAIRVADALEAAHRQGVIHRDIKPENILLDGDNPLVADFGIARLVGDTAGGTVSTSGIVVGTPGYMSPEQIVGDQALDGRSDVYSLGCVLFEMLGGEPPYTGPTAQAIASRHLHESIPSIGLIRPQTPAWLEAIVTKSLAKLRVDRFGSAAELRDALEAGPANAAPPEPRRRRWWTVLVAAGVVVASGVGWAAWRWWRPEPLDESRYVAIHFRQVGDVSGVGLDGSRCATLAYDALGRWTDIERVDRLKVEELVERDRGPPQTLSEAVEIARQARAGRMIWGELVAVGDTGLFIRAWLYDVGRDEPMAEHGLAVSHLRSDSTSVWLEGLVDSLLARSGPAPPLGTPRPHAALEAYLDGSEALAGWNLELAWEGFRRALELEPAYPQAALRFAQLSQWLGRPAGEWESAARQAGASPQLSPGDRGLGTALEAFGQGRYPASCDRYRSLVAADSSGFAAWLGLGDCQSADPVVVRDPASRSGWRFRSSYESAARAYARALAVLPSAHRAGRDLMMARLTRVLKTSAGQFRSGVAAGVPDSAFAAFPELDADTIAYVPVPASRLFAASAVLPATTAGARGRSQRWLGDLSREWVATFPQSAAAWEARARALEFAGVLAGGSETALGSIREARRLVRDSSVAIHLAIAELRLLVKTEAWRPARAMADSLLELEDLAPSQALEVAPVAGLVGRPLAMADLLQRGAVAEEFTDQGGRPFRAPMPIAVPALRLLAFAVAGGPADSVSRSEDAVWRLLEEWPAPGERVRVSVGILGAAAQFGFPRYGARRLHDLAEESGMYLLRLQSRFDRGDTSGVRASLDGLRRLRAAHGVLSYEVGIDAVYQEAWLRVAVGDSAGAAESLDAALAALPLQQTTLLQKAQGPASLVLAMALRARIATRRGDSATARRWAAPVVELWRDADPSLRSLVAEVAQVTGR